MRLFYLVIFVLLGTGPALAKEKPPASYSIPLPPKPDYTSLQWLVGEWTGKTTNRGPQGEIRLSVEVALDGRFMILREELNFAATKASPATRESWLGILSANRSESGFHLRTFSSTGFITRHRVTVTGSEIHFYPEGGEQPPPGWLFRRSLQRSGETEIIETVETAPPDKSFFDYFTAKLTQATKP